MTIEKPSSQTVHGKGPSPSRVLPNDFYLSFLSDVAKARKPAPIRSLIPMESKPGMLSMLAGKPNPSTYPFTRITMTVKSPSPLSDPTLTDIELGGDDLSTALQYSMTSGLPALVEWVTELAAQVHGITPGDGARVSMGSGSQDLLYKAFSALINRGDSIIVEAPTYPGILPVMDSLGCNIVEVASDDEGIVSSSLARLLESWPSGKSRPKLLYTIPYGANPTGMTTSLPRRQEVLKLARKYNFLILEDDPYYHLYFGSGAPPASYFSLERKMDGDIGRVLRFDSLSKILAAGFRLGWITGPDYLVAQIERHSAASTMQPPSISQVIVLKLLQSWGISGFLTHAESVAEFYRQKRDVFETYLNKHLSGLAQWNTPNAAMFYWIKLKLPPSGSVKCKTVKGYEGDSNVFIEHNAMRKGVLMLPGECGYHDERKTCYVRVSFSLLSEEEVDEVLRRLASALRDEWEQ
ncbi:TdiD protein [Hymenopellis radicata]|nr:TdiD protein [Hymenopellis radicata]